MNHSLFFLLIFFSLNTTAQGSLVKLDSLALQQEINNTPYIVEGTITNVEIYAGDREGNRLSDDHIRWVGGEGNYYFDDGSVAIGYSKATFEICQVLKGQIKTKKIEIITSPDGFKACRRIYNDLDTMMYDYWPSEYSYEIYFLPQNKGKHIIFFLNKNFESFDTYYQPNKIGFISITTEKERNQIMNNTSINDPNDIPYSAGFIQFNNIPKFFLRKDLNEFLQQ